MSGTKLASINSKYSVTDAMKEKTGYKACWVCPTNQEAIILIRNIKAIATKARKKTKCHKQLIPRYEQSFDSLSISSQLIMNGTLKPEELPSDWLVIMEITSEADE